MAEAALRREESRGAHYRTDFPKLDARLAAAGSSSGGGQAKRVPEEAARDRRRGARPIGLHDQVLTRTRYELGIGCLQCRSRGRSTGAMADRTRADRRTSEGSRSKPSHRDLAEMPPERPRRGRRLGRPDDRGTRSARACAPRPTCSSSRAGVLAGLPVLARRLPAVDPATSVELPGRRTAIGSRPGRRDRAGPGQARSLLTAERVALNFLQRLSGIATVTARYVEAVAGTKAAIIDTRKTTPGLRSLEKWAVRMGGGQNHRRNLSDGVLIKDNHLVAIAASGTDLAEAVARRPSALAAHDQGRGRGRPARSDRRRARGRRRHHPARQHVRRHCSARRST